jgi:hypothetical protein
MNALAPLSSLPSILSVHGARALVLLALASSFALGGCGGSASAGAAQTDGEADDDDWDDDMPDTAGTEYTGSAIETLGITGPDTPWADMSEEDREFYMIGKVLPIMHELFARHDAQEYEGFSCESCHGANMREVHFETPVATIFRLPEPGSQAWSVMEATQGDAVRFMRDEVTPTMGTLLGVDDYSCFHCHARR